MTSVILPVESHVILFVPYKLSYKFMYNAAIAFLSF